MKKSKRILSAITALALSASAFASMVIPASAAEVAISGADYDFEAANSAWTCDNEDLGITVVEDATLSSKVLKGTLASKKATTTGTVSLPTAITPETDGYVKVTFDWYSKTIGLSDYTETVLVDASGKQIVSISEAYSGRSTAPTNVVSVNGTEVTTSSNATISAFTWYTVTAMVDFGTKQVSSLSFTPSGTSTASATLTDLAFKDKDASSIAGIYINSYKGSGDINLTWAIDNFKAYNITETYVADFTVKAGNEPLEGAKVTIDSKDYLTDANGKAYVRLSDGSHDYIISKGGYEVAQGSSLTGSVTSSAKTVSAEMQIETYTQIATKATVSGGQRLISAPTTDTPATSTAFTVAVKDQFDFDMSTGYTTAWAVYPTGTTTANENVTIENGIVSVAKGYKAAEDAAVFDVVATVTDSNDNTKTATNKATIIVANSDIVAYDMETSYTATGAKNKDFELGEIDIPETGLRLSFDFFKGKYDSTKDTAYGKLSVMNGENAVLYLEDKNAGLTIHTDGDNSLELGSTARDTAYPTELSILGSQLVVKFNNGDYKVVQFDEAPTKITAIQASTSQDGGSGTGATNLVISTKLNVDTKGVNIIGDDKFAVIAGKTVTRQYTAKPYISEASDNFVWTVTEKAGVSIDSATGVLSVTDQATPGTVTVTATSGTKTGSLEVTIADVQKYTADVEYPKAVEKGGEGQFTVNKITDALGDDVTEYFSPTWSIDGAADADASLSYTGLTPGKATAVYATYKDNALVSVSSEPVTVDSDGALSVTAPSGAKVYIWDNLNHIMPLTAEVKTAPVTELENTQLAAIGSKSGKFTTNKNAESGTANVKLNITGSDTTPAVYPVKVDTFYLTDPQVTEGKVNIAGLVKDEAITGYQITTVKDGVAETSVVDKTDVTDNMVTVGAVNDENGDELEIAPVFGTVIGTELLVPADSYNITITANNAGRADVYVNSQMVVNNLNQGSDSTWNSVKGAYPETATYTYKDIVVKEGSAKFKYEDKQGEPASSIAMVKAPTIVERTRKVYAIGDSLVANYYDRVGAANPQLCRTGWGQVLDNYLKDVDVVNLGNSGAWATGMYHDAFTQVRESARSGDIVLWESGYNDREHSNEADMKAAITAAVNECNAMGVDIYLVTPNASAHDLRPTLQYSGYMRDLNKSTGAPLIDLAQTSFDFLNAHYGPFVFNAPYYSFPNDDIKNVEIANYHNASDTLHSTQNAANVWASLVAGALYDAGETDIVNTEYTYTFTDTKTTPETFNIKVTPSAE